MRRDEFSIDLDNIDWLEFDNQPEQPCLIIAFDGPEEELRDRFRGPDGSGYTPDELDIFYRLQSSNRPAASGGVFSVSDRVTGEYLLETGVSPNLIEEFVYAMRQYTDTGDGGCQYVVEIWIGDRRVAEFEKETFLVYGSDRNLLRCRSLIPDGIEI